MTNMLISDMHCQKGLTLIIVSYEIRDERTIACLPGQVGFPEQLNLSPFCHRDARTAQLTNLVPGNLLHRMIFIGNIKVNVQ